MTINTLNLQLKQILSVVMIYSNGTPRAEDIRWKLEHLPVNSCVILLYFNRGKATELEIIPPLKMTVLKTESFQEGTSVEFLLYLNSHLCLCSLQDSGPNVDS